MLLSLVLCEQCFLLVTELDNANKTWLSCQVTPNIVQLCESEPLFRPIIFPWPIGSLLLALVGSQKMLSDEYTDDCTGKNRALIVAIDRVLESCAEPWLL